MSLRKLRFEFETALEGSSVVGAGLVLSNCLRKIEMNRSRSASLVGYHLVPEGSTVDVLVARAVDVDLGLHRPELERMIWGTVYIPMRDP